MKPLTVSRSPSMSTPTVNHTPANSFVPVSPEHSALPDSELNRSRTPQTNAVPPSSLTPTPPPTAPHHAVTPSSLTPTPPPLEHSPPHQTRSLTADGRGAHDSIARPVPPSSTASHQVSSLPLAELKTGKVDTSRLCLTPSPDLPDTSLLETAFMKDQSATATHDISLQSGSELQSPRSSSPSLTPCPPSLVGVGDTSTQQSRQRPSSASSTSSRDSRKTAAKPSTHHGSKGKGVLIEQCVHCMLETCI